MKLRTLAFLGIATIIGVYTSTKEGGETRKQLKSIGKSIQPVVKDLITKAEKIIQKSRTMKSDEIRLNIEKKAEEIKKTLKNINIDDVTKRSISIIKTTTSSIQRIWSNLNNEIEKTQTIPIVPNKVITEDSKNQVNNINNKKKSSIKKFKKKKVVYKKPTKGK